MRLELEPGEKDNMEYQAPISTKKLTMYCPACRVSWDPTSCSDTERLERITLVPASVQMRGVLLGF